ncbi:GGDEF domain-containing protein [Petrotoga sp. 9PWA.NaAc.5.4]|uniref:GGDEF domain-containing protein n=1 Tax=Petrotoga sp. 9PWA.NaAc.5.4 TaxID=1434328 RepID=UPI000EFA40B5|nr:GGDEF domain-containing protein [Petrotoga sp. 9PWA.NaAc.5.4]
MNISEGNLAFYLCDNRYNAKPITDVQLEILDYFAKQSALIWQNKVFMNILKEEAELDTLTKVGNRRSYEKYISSLTYLKNMKIAFAFIDIDNFKEINDRFGHENGDKILKELSQIMINNFRKSDKIFRYGGDEFIIILSNISKENAIKVLGRLKNVFFEKTGCTLSVGISFGNSNEIYSLFLKADENLYKAKKEGKNNIFYV